MKSSLDGIHIWTESIRLSHGQTPVELRPTPRRQTFSTKYSEENQLRRWKINPKWWGRCLKEACRCDFKIFVDKYTRSNWVPRSKTQLFSLKQVFNSLSKVFRPLNFSETLSRLLCWRGPWSWILIEAWQGSRCSPTLSSSSRYPCRKLLTNHRCLYCLQLYKEADSRAALLIKILFIKSFLLRKKKC